MSTSPSQPRVLLVLTSVSPMFPDGLHSGYFFSEVAEPYSAFISAGFTVDVCSETGTAVVDPHSIDPSMMSKDVYKDVWSNKSHPIHSLLAHVQSAEQVTEKMSEYSIIFFCGGHACLWDFPKAKLVQQLAADVYEKNQGIVAAVCHGPAVLGGITLSSGVPLIKDKKVTGFSIAAEKAMKLEPFLREQRLLFCSEIAEAVGGQWEEDQKNPMGEYVVESGRLITGQNPASAEATAKAAINAYKNAPRFT